MNAIIAIDIILLLLAILLFLWTWTKKPKSEKTEARPDSSSSKTQKISAIGKTIFGALGKIVSWVLIAGLIAGAALLVHCFLFPSADILYFTPDQWNEKDHGWQVFIDSEELETYKIKVSSSYDKCFFRDGKEVYYPISPNGRTWRNNWPSSEFRRHLPLPDRPVGMVIAKADGKIIPVGYGRKITAKTICLNINAPQNWTDAPGTTFADNFIHNRGSLRVEIEKDWAIFEKIAQVFNSLMQRFKG